MRLGDRFKLKRQPNRKKGVSRVTQIEHRGYRHERHVKIRFLALEEIKPGTIFGTASGQPQKPNRSKGVPK